MKQTTNQSLTVFCISMGFGILCAMSVIEMIKGVFINGLMTFITFLLMYAGLKYWWERSLINNARRYNH